MDFDVLIVGGGAAGMSCALVLGSGLSKPYGNGKRAGIILHQKASHLQSALLNNALGIQPGTAGREILESGRDQLRELYREVAQVEGEKLVEIEGLEGGFRLLTNKKSYFSKIVVIAVGYTKFFNIKGLEKFVIPHQKSRASKERIQLKNADHVVIENLYVAGSLAGHRSQFSIACGSGAAVATDILTSWNAGEHTKVHDKFQV